MTVTVGSLAVTAAGEVKLLDSSSTPAQLEAAKELPVKAMDLNAAAVGADGLFAAVPGTRAHGARYASQSQAVAILTDAQGVELLREAGETRPVIEVADVRTVMGPVASEIYGHPSRELTVIGVTGTSGKTTTTYMLESALIGAGKHTGIIGTTGTRINGRKVPSSLTTPEAPSLQRLFREMLDDGVTHVAMEVSSHALSLGRVSGVDFDVTCFLNLSQDHLDFHNTLEEYFDAKAVLFQADSPLHAPQAVICINDDAGRKMAGVAAEAEDATVTTVATNADAVQTGAEAGAGLPGIAASWQLESVSVADNGVQEATLDYHADTKRQVTLDIPLPGAFNVANAAVAWAALVAAGVESDGARQGLAKVSVPGRMQRIDRCQDFLAVVDYAHKPAAVAEVLATVRNQASGKLIVVVGAGGDRDATKRPLMGAEAVRGAEVVIITDDNPRSEDPAKIREAVAEGAYDEAKKLEAAEGKQTQIEVIGDRGEAIRKAISYAETGDVVVVAGKGHETGQDVGGVIHHFDDREEVANALEARNSAQNAGGSDK